MHNNIFQSPGLSIGDRYLSLEHILQYCLFFRVTPMEAFRNIEFVSRFSTIKANQSLPARKCIDHVQRGKMAVDALEDRKARLLAQCAAESSEYKRICIKLSIALQELRLNAGISQKILAEILGITDHAVRDIEKGAIELTYRHIVAYAVAIDVDPLIVFAKADVDWKHFINREILFDVNIFKDSNHVVKTKWKKALVKIEIK